MKNNRIGLSVGDATVAAKLDHSAFQSAAGGFDRDAYRQILQRNNLTEAAFESGLRADMARQILQNTVTGGFCTPEALTTTLANWAGRRTQLFHAALDRGRSDPPLPAATDAELQKYYADHIAAFRIAYGSMPLTTRRSSTRGMP